VPAWTGDFAGVDFATFLPGIFFLAIDLPAEALLAEPLLVADLVAEALLVDVRALAALAVFWMARCRLAVPSAARALPPAAVLREVGARPDFDGWVLLALASSLRTDVRHAKGGSVVKA
jgi:hypothetical protein